MNTFASKPELRKQLKRKLKALSLDDLQRKSWEVCKNILSVDPLVKKSPMALGLFRALPGEVQLNELVQQLAKTQIRFFYPRVENNEIRFYEVSDPEAHSWQKGKYGIEEPQVSASDSTPAHPKEVALQMILVPGLGFGLRGERVGRGKGYYDRYLERSPSVFKIGVAFDLQILENGFSKDDWDISMNRVCTESRIL